MLSNFFDPVWFVIKTGIEAEKMTFQRAANDQLE